MSYILQALKKAEEARGATPRAVPMPRALPPASRRLWPWVAGGLGAGAAIVVVAALWAFAPARTAVVTALPSPRVAPPPAAGIEPTPATAREPIAPPLPADASARLEPASPAVERSSGTRAGREAVAPGEHPSARAAARAEAMRPPSPAKRPVAAVAPPTAPPERVIPPRSVAPPPVPAAPAGNLKALVAKLSLQVLSWSPDPKDRFVFVSGRKYVEGQAIDDKLVVERITDGGVVLSYQGERATLKSP